MVRLRDIIQALRDQAAATRELAAVQREIRDLMPRPSTRAAASDADETAGGVQRPTGWSGPGG